MADIFLSYSSNDRDRVGPIIAALERRGWSVWWDREILPGGSFEELIDEAIAEVRCVVVAWSATAIQSRWVKNEALEGLEREILVPLMLDEVRISVAFRQTQAARLFDDQLDPASDGFLQLLDGVSAVLGKKAIESEPGEDLSAADVPRKSIAVMPFKDMSASQEFNWLGDGVAEDLINGLTQISDLYVSPRTDSFGFRDSKQRVTAIGRALGVTNVLDGSVRVAGDKARISVELVNVADGFQLWSGQFDGALDDVFSFQDEITVKVVDALKIAMTESFRSQLKFLGSSNIEVHRLMQQSMLENPAERVRKLERIIQIEPDSIGPRRVLAGSLSALQTAEGVDPEDKLKIRQLLEDIFQADRNNLRSESWLESYQLLSMDWKWREALEILVRTIKTGDFQALDQGAGPNPNPVLSLIRMNLEGGNFKACRATLEYVSRFSPRASNALIWVHLAARDMEKTIKTALSTLASQPADAFVVSGLMTAYIKTGRIVEARDLLGRFNMLGTVHRAKLFEALIEIVGGDIQKGVMLADEFEKTAQGLPFFRGILKMHMGEIDDGFDRWFEAVEKKDDLVTWVNFMYAYAPDGIVDDPRFEEVRRAAGRDHAWKLELGEVTASLSADIGIEYEIDTSPQFPQWPGSQV